MKIRTKHNLYVFSGFQQLDNGCNETVVLLHVHQSFKFHLFNIR
jgi:hypothetical protein